MLNHWVVNQGCVDLCNLLHVVPSRVLHAASSIQILKTGNFLNPVK